MGFSVLLIKAFEVFKINEPASAGFFINLLWQEEIDRMHTFVTIPQKPKFQSQGHSRPEVGCSCLLLLGVQPIKDLLAYSRIAEVGDQGILGFFARSGLHPCER